MSEEIKPVLLIIDGHALIYRAFHAFPPLSNREGMIIGALYGFLRILLSVMRDVQPEYWLIAFDHPAPTKRKLEYDFYKANRKEMPEELCLQIPLIEEAVCKFGIPMMKIAGVEADDLIGTISREVCDLGNTDVRILTGDRDSFQLVDDCVHVLVPNLGRRVEKKDKNKMLEYNPALVEQKVFVRPDQIIDLKALAGDASDNISGVPGIGNKTAVDLLHQFGTLDAVYRAIDNEQVHMLRSGVVAKLIAGREAAYVSQKLATIDRHVPDLGFDLGCCHVNGYDKQEMADLLTRHGFTSLIKLLPQDQFDTGLQEALF